MPAGGKVRHASGVTARHSQSLCSRRPLLLSVIFGVRLGGFSITEITDFTKESGSRNWRPALEI